MELDFNSVERVGEYLNIQQEAPAIIEKARPPAYWPSSTSGIIVENLWIRYSLGSPDVLRGLSFTVSPGEKIGVVGRTGSGKTTLCGAFLRVVEPHKGHIMYALYFFLCFFFAYEQDRQNRWHRHIHHRPGRSQNQDCKI